MSRNAHQRLSSTQALAKVPEITVLFWVIKILTTAMGEATSDTLAHGLGPVLAVSVGGLGFAIALALQFSVKRYIPWVYWLAVVMVAVFGTMAADGLHVEVGIPYLATTSFFAVVLVAVFITWFVTEKSLSIHSIYTRRREVFYWLTVMSTFALGTAAGDLTATTFGLGYFKAGILFTVLFILPALAYWWLGLPEVAAFWLSYVLTRPLGASFADWFGVAASHGGLGFGTLKVATMLTVLIIIAVGYLTITHSGINRRRFKQS